MQLLEEVWRFEHAALFYPKGSLLLQTFQSFDSYPQLRRRGNPSTFHYFLQWTGSCRNQGERALVEEPLLFALAGCSRNFHLINLLVVCQLVTVLVGSIALAEIRLLQSVEGACEKQELQLNLFQVFDRWNRDFAMFGIPLRRLFFQLLDLAGP